MSDRFEKGIVEDVLRCHLAGLIILCGPERVPKGLNGNHPDAATVDSKNLTNLVNIYTTFLRSP